MSMLQAGPWPDVRAAHSIGRPTFCALYQHQVYSGAMVGLVMAVVTLTHQRHWSRFPVCRTRNDRHEIVTDSRYHQYMEAIINGNRPRSFLPGRPGSLI